MATELPVGFAMALAMNEPAMKKFESLSPAEKESVIQQAHGVKSRQEMRQFAASIADCPSSRKTLISHCVENPDNG